MRSRYSAFSVGDAAYLLATWHPSTRPKKLSLSPGIVWLRLVVESVSHGGPWDTDGTVEFTAYYRSGSERYEQHETSRFVRQDRTWLYLDGQD
jgi:SEC-C motif-containing protein